MIVILILIQVLLFLFLKLTKDIILVLINYLVLIKMIILLIIYQKNGMILYGNHKKMIILNLKFLMMTKNLFGKLTIIQVITTNLFINKDLSEIVFLTYYFLNLLHFLIIQLFLLTHILILSLTKDNQYHGLINTLIQIPLTLKII